MSNETNSPNEWYVPPPSRETAVVSALLGLWGGAVTAVAISAHTTFMAVVLGLASVALVVLAVRTRGGATGIASAPHGMAETVGKWLGALRTARPSKAPARSQAAPPLSVAEEIAKLGELRDAGLLTEAEFTAQKAKLLDR